MKDKTKITITIILILLIGIFGYMAFFNEDRECLKQKANEYCETNNLDYSGAINIWPPIFFWCYPEKDKHLIEKFTFTEEERNYCRRIG